MNKRFVLLLILILTASSLIAVKPTHASVNKPSVPEFTVKFIDSSYNVTTTDPYTGLGVTKQFDNNTIEITIKNQPYAYSSNGLTYHLYYNVRTKPHFEGNWTERYPVLDRPNSPYDWENRSWSYSKYLFNPNSPNQSDSDYTVITYALGENGYYLFTSLPSNAQLDFQVEAIVGHDSQAWAIVHPFTPEYGGSYEPAIAFDETSGWSNTQTITISAPDSTTTPGTSTPNTSPSQNSTTPSPTDQSGSQNVASSSVDWAQFATLALLGVIAVLLVIAVVYLRRRSTKST